MTPLSLSLGDNGHWTLSNKHGDMRARIETVRVGSAWQWDVYCVTGGLKIHLGGGYCRTKADALNDASILANSRQ